MEIQLSSLGERPTASAISLVAAPAGLGTSARNRSMSGAGVYQVAALRGLDHKVGDFGCPIAMPAQLDQTDPQIFTHKFTTRLGPPTCSPPV